MNNQEINFAYKIRHAINENLEQLPASTTTRLATARQLALTRKKYSSELPTKMAVRGLVSTAGDFFDQPFSWLSRFGLFAPVFVLLLGIAGLFQLEQQRHIKETADMDALVLSDELPISAYLDHGFSAYMATRDE